MLYRYKEQDTFLCASEKIFSVVIDVEKYPDFVPWCKAVRIREKINEQIMIVDILTVFHGIKKNYTSKVEFCSPHKMNEGWIKTVSESRIFKHLYNKWKFIPNGENKATVEFYIEFEFESNILSYLLNSLQEYIKSKIIFAFKQRVESITNRS